MNVTLSKAITVNMPDGPVHLHAGLNTDVAENVAGHWYVKQHETEPAQPNATETALQLEVNYQTARADAAEGKVLAAEQRADAAEQRARDAAGALDAVHFDKDLAEKEADQLRAALASMQAERDGHAARADAAETKLRQARAKRAQEPETEGGA